MQTMWRKRPFCERVPYTTMKKASRRAAMATMVTARVMGRAVWEEKAAAGKVLEKPMREDPKEVREVEKVMAIKEHASNP